MTGNNVNFINVFVFLGSCHQFTMSTSQKHQSFISEPMGEKPVTELAGIGEVLGKRLTNKGYDKVGIIVSDQCQRWLLNQNLLLAGICRARPVPGAEEERGIVCRMAQGRGECQHKAGQGLFPVSHRMVRAIPLKLRIFLSTFQIFIIYRKICIL